MEVDWTECHWRPSREWACPAPQPERENDRKKWRSVECFRVVLVARSQNWQRTDNNGVPRSFVYSPSTRTRAVSDISIVRRLRITSSRDKIWVENTGRLYTDCVLVSVGTTGYKSSMKKWRTVQHVSVASQSRQLTTSSIHCPLHRPPSEAGLFEVVPLTRAWIQQAELTIWDETMIHERRRRILTSYTYISAFHCPRISVVHVRGIMGKAVDLRTEGTSCWAPSMFIHIGSHVRGHDRCSTLLHKPSPTDSLFRLR